MAINRNDIEVTIDGKTITISGDESVEYQQKVAAYVNNTIAEFKKLDSFRLQSPEMQSIYIEINIADEYFKAKKELDAIREELDSKDRELYDLKHELIATQIKLESREKQLKTLQNK